MSHLLQWLAEARAYTADLERENERMARALGGIASFCTSNPDAQYLQGIASKAIEGQIRYPAKPLDPATGALCSD